MAPPAGIDLDQYRAQAKELLKNAQAADAAALARFRERHPEGDALAASGRFQLADAQLVFAREHGFASWPRFREYLLVRNGIAAIDAGDLPRLRALLDRYPRLVRLRCRAGEWYEEGYFKGAMLLHHVAGNPIRGPLPANVVEIARLLLERGADPNAVTETGGSTIGLLLTGKQPSDAGVGMALVDLLRAAGARDYDTAEALTSTVLNHAPATARELVRRGAQMDLRHAAGLGEVAALERLLAEDEQRALLEEALTFACIRGEEAAARVLIDHGARGDVLVTPGGRTPRTALHEAANRGHRRIVDLLLERGAATDVVEPHFGGTPAGWAEHGGHPDLAAMLRQRQHAPTK